MPEIPRTILLFCSTLKVVLRLLEDLSDLKLYGPVTREVTGLLSMLRLRGSILSHLPGCVDLYSIPVEASLFGTRINSGKFSCRLKLLNKPLQIVKQTMIMLLLGIEIKS